MSSGCPTFSWAAVSGAAGYVVEVYEMATSDVQARGAVSALPVLRNEISAPALSWTPSAGQCLFDGLRYVWYVGSVSAGGAVQWSAGSAFEVNLFADSQAVDAVKETVKNYLQTEWTKTDSYAQVKKAIKEDISNDTKTAAGGDRSISLAYQGTYNTFYGTGAGNTLGAVDGSQYATFIGADAGYSNTTSGYDNTFVGKRAGYSNTTGSSNTFLGSRAGDSNTTGASNTFVGVNAGQANTTEGFNTFVGQDAGTNNTACCNAFVGRAAGRSNTTGTNNVFMGNNAGQLNTTGSDNTMIGRAAGYSNTTGGGNAFFGRESGYSNTGSNNTFLGNLTGRSNTTGWANTFVGEITQAIQILQVTGMYL